MNDNTKQHILAQVYIQAENEGIIHVTLFWLISSDKFVLVSLFILANNTNILKIYSCHEKWYASIKLMNIINYWISVYI